LVIGFLNLVSVDAKERSLFSNFLHRIYKVAYVNAFFK